MQKRKQSRQKLKGKPAAKPAGPPQKPAASGDGRPLSALADEVAEESRAAGMPVVGLGASAGGLDAFKKFFSSMPGDSGMAFVVVPHLDPTHESLMVELLKKYTHMPVVEATEGVSIAVNHVYIIPPNKYLAIREGVLRLSGPVERHGPSTSIDLFLRSLAQDRGERAIGVILSGTSSHGSLGLRDIKAHGGMTMVQDPATAEYAEMPKSAIATGLVDYVLPPERMPEMLINFVQHSYVSGDEEGAAAKGSSEQLDQIVTFMRTRMRFDFRCYRKSMLLRRVQRRMGLNRIEKTSDYAVFLRDHPHEAKELAKDLFISVTQFFRDPEAFRALAKQAIAEIVKHCRNDVPLRAWVPGCATGEEAFSVAMLLFEGLSAAHKDCRIQVFATDVDEDALAVARRAVYPAKIAADVSPQRLERFFTLVEEHNYQVKKELRDTVTFAVQNVLRDPPFSKMDLINCRNVLIYIEPEIQHQIISLFHFALNATGYLALGPSETIGRNIDQFEPVSQKWRIYRKIGLGSENLNFPVFAAGERRGRPADTGIPPRASVDVGEITRRLLLAEYAPAAVLASAGGQILYFQGPTMLYLDQPSDEPSRDLLEMCRDGIRSRLRVAMGKAASEGRPVTVRDARVKRNGENVKVAFTVKPIERSKSSSAMLLVTFQDIAELEPNPVSLADTPEEPVVRQLELELKTTRDELQSTIEELESTNEELKAGNEEMMSMNEELQSANEELETSKEELQSLNEELTTVNSQLQEKVESLELVNNDISNLLNSTEIATIFLTLDYRIRRFTPASARLFRLRTSDVGRPLTDISHTFIDATLRSDIERVLQDLAPVERNIETADNTWFLRRVHLYRTHDNRIDGVVLVFTDVTLLKKAELALRQNKELELLAAVLKDSNDAIIVQDFEGRIESWNHSAERLYGYSEAEALRMNVRALIPEANREQEASVFERVRRSEPVESWVTRRLSKDGRLLDVWLTATALRGDGGDVQAISTTERDITEHKQMEKALHEIATLEQRRIGQDLHDSAGQQLTGLALIAETLMESLRKQNSSEAPLATKLVEGVKRVLTQVRTLARGLVPVEIDTMGLMGALDELASRISELHSIACTFEHDRDASIDDCQTATQLYLIAQEAVINAVKHAHAQHIAIDLRRREGNAILSVRDDGAGISEKKDRGGGMGLPIMRYRANLINANVKIEPADKGGTLITCTVNDGRR